MARSTVAAELIGTDRTDGGVARARGAVDGLARKIRRFSRLSRQTQELADDIVFEFAVVRRALELEKTGRLSAVVEYALRQAGGMRQRRAMVDSLKAAAKSGAAKVDIRPGRRGAAMVCVDGGKWFELSGRLARLLSVLVAGVPPGADGFPSWQSLEKTAAQLTPKAGGRSSRRSVVQAVYRLRQIMKARGVNPQLLQSDRRRGLRFLIRQDSG